MAVLLLQWTKVRHTQLEANSEIGLVVIRDIGSVVQGQTPQIVPIGQLGTVGALLPLDSVLLASYPQYYEQITLPQLVHRGNAISSPWVVFYPLLGGKYNVGVVEDKKLSLIGGTITLPENEGSIVTGKERHCGLLFTLQVTTSPKQPTLLCCAHSTGKITIEKIESDTTSGNKTNILCSRQREVSLRSALCNQKPCAIKYVCRLSDSDIHKVVEHTKRFYRSRCLRPRTGLSSSGRGHVSLPSSVCAFIVHSKNSFFL